MDLPFIHFYRLQGRQTSLNLNSVAVDTPCNTALHSFRLKIRLSDDAAEKSIPVDIFSESEYLSS